MRLVRLRCRLLLWVALMGVVAVAAGCGGGSDSTGGAGSSGADATSGAAETTGSGGATEMPAVELEPGFSDWPYFGRVPERTHYLADDPVDRIFLDPPLRQAWSINTHALIEFPPAIHRGVAYVINKFGNGKAVRLSDRKVLWELNLDPKNKGEEPVDVTGPVYYKGKVFGAFKDGHLAAGDAKSGKEVWVKDLHAELESSPLVIGGLLYIGTNGKQLLALDPDTGKTVWKYQAPDEIKASTSYHAGTVFGADYASAMFALDARSGKQIWSTDTSQAGGSGGFFSSPAVAFGRVYAARDDGTVFALDEKTGKIEWSFPTGAAVYGSPAVAQVPGTPPTVYIGSENGTFYALDAKTGKQRWSYEVGGPVPGTATVIGHTVYTSSFTPHRTVGLDARTHKKTFELGQGGYTPVVSDGKRLYLVGYYTLIGLEPTAKAKAKDRKGAGKQG
ncbi:MAG TPA: PQQ-binding-like beta-propeller repeat protein [Solirubrobacterales bacterium]|nr:PQQ-binding-like beta-propeller repeat protein [Solirubrobacterales bacterium]